MSTSPTDSTKAALTSTRRSTTRRSPSPRTSAGTITSPHSTATPSAGILRISNKPRRASGSSVEFRVPPEQQLQAEPASPQPSVDRLSVSFAADTPGGSGSGSVAQTSPLPATPQSLTRSACIMGVSGTARGQRPPPLILNGTDLKSRLAAETSDLGEEDEDYSASLSAIIQRRNSTLRRSHRRRPSSPFSPGGVPGGMASGVAGGISATAGAPTAAQGGAGFVGTPAATPAVRRRSSVFTTSSGDTGASADSDGQEQIMENLKLHKEVLLGAKQQPWGMRRKLKLVRLAKTYVKRHEGQLQQRRATRDVLARFKLFLLKKWQRIKRDFANLLNVLLPWEARIKEIESHFGSVVASYFTFLRWLCWVNLVITVVTIAFIVVPEITTDDFKTASERKELLPEERKNATSLLTLWDFGGVLKYSPLFYGYYRNQEGRPTAYRVPFAYFMTGLVLYVYSFVAILRKMAANSRMSKLSEKDDECIFTWKLFTGWDYMIGNAETAHNKVASTILGFKEALLEEAEKQRQDTNWRIIAARIFVNISVTILLGTSAFAVVSAVERSKESDAESTVWRRNETTVIINIVNFVFPALFELLGLLERYHPRKTLRLQLRRIMLLNLLNLYTFIFSTFSKITDTTEQLAMLKQNHTANNISLTASCSCIGRGSSSLTTIAAVTLAISTASRINSTTTIMPMTSVPISTWHPTTFTALIPAMLTAPSSITTRNTSTSISYSLTPPNSIATQFTTPASISTKNTRTLSTESTYRSSTGEQYEEGPTLSSVDNSFDSSIVLTTTNEAIFSTLSTESDTTDDPFSSSEQTSPGNKYHQYSSSDRFESTDQQTEEPPSTTPIVALLSGRYLRKRSVQSNEVEAEDDYDYSDSAEGSTNSPLVTTPWIPDETPSDDTLSEDLDDDYPSTISETGIPSSTTLDNASTGTTDVTGTASSSFSATPGYEIYSTSSNIPSSSTTAFGSGTTAQKTFSPPTTESSTTTTVSEVTVPMSPSVTTIQTTSTTQIDVTTVDTADVSPEPTCPEEQCENEEKHHFKRRSNIDLEMRGKLKNLCWETMFGQELVKMTVTDLVMTILSTLSVDFFRAVFVRVMNNCWCWDLEKKFPQYGDFKIAENILHLVNNQGMVWMGMFFSPGLALINVVKLAVMFYLRSWAVLTCNVPHEVVFRASRSNNFYLALLLTMLFLCVLPVGYAVIRLTPSWHCGPFSSYNRAHIIFTESLHAFVPLSLHDGLDYVASPGIVIPLLLLLSLVIYYLVSLTNSLREANNDLKIQLRRERTEERRRMFQLVERRRRGATGSTDLTDKLKKLTALQSTRDEESTVDQPTGGARPDNAARRKELLTRLLKHALRKSSATSDEESGAGVADQEADGDGTDAEQPDSLPEDAPTKTTSKSGRSAMSQAVDQGRKVNRQPSQPPTAPAQPPQGTSPTVSSHREREDSVASAWSDNIPVIRISKTESTDCVVDLDQDERNPTGSADTVVAADDLAAVEEKKRERREAVGRAIIQEARRRRDSIRDDAVKSETVKDDGNDDTVSGTGS